MPGTVLGSGDTTGAIETDTVPVSQPSEKDTPDHNYTPN